MTPLERFWSKVCINPETGCWEWQGKVHNGGYGRIYDGSKVVRAHRFSYEEYVGPIPECLVLDHLCRNPGCVNFQHLEAVTDKVNILRGVGCSALNAQKTHCPKGHEYSTENTWLDRLGRRLCRTCWQEREWIPGGKDSQPIHSEKPSKWAQYFAPEHRA